jgi:Putative peptidoglycan binding domain
MTGLECVVINRITIAVAVAGWALYGFSVLGPQSPGADAQTEIARLSEAAEMAGAERDALTAELERFRDEHQNLQHLQKQIAITTQELQHLEYLRGRISGEIDTMRPRTPEAASRASGSDEISDPSTVQSIPLSKEEISNAQEALTKLGYGPLQADGMLGPGTRRSIENFQRAQGLPVTGRPSTDTLRALRAAQKPAQP